MKYCSNFELNTFFSKYLSERKIDCAFCIIAKWNVLQFVIFNKFVIVLYIITDLIIV